MQNRSREQKLVDILFEVAMMTKESKSLQELDREKYAEWIRHQLDLCGFKNFGPIGVLWCKLLEEKSNDD